jgi:SAM-dependent methyltransferase
VNTKDWWAGDGGNLYTARNRVDWQKRARFWREIVTMIAPKSVFEVGCNAGWNLSAIRLVNSEINVEGCDINASAVNQARACGLNVLQRSVPCHG